MMVDTAWRVPKYGVFSGPNAGKYGPEKTPYLDTFHVVWSKKTKVTIGKDLKSMIINIDFEFGKLLFC